MTKSELIEILKGLELPLSEKDETLLKVGKLAEKLPEGRISFIEFSKLLYKFVGQKPEESKSGKYVLP